MHLFPFPFIFFYHLNLCYAVVKVRLDARERSFCTSNYWDPAFSHLRFHKKRSGAKTTCLEAQSWRTVPSPLIFHFKHWCYVYSWLLVVWCVSSYLCIRCVTMEHRSFNICSVFHLALSIHPSINQPIKSVYCVKYSN